MLTGYCHCRAVRWEFEDVIEGVTACNCTLCRRYGTLWAYSHEGKGVELIGPTSVYQEGEGDACEFHFCPKCGCVVSWRGKRLNAEGNRRMAVNVRLVDDPEKSRLTPSIISTGSTRSTIFRGTGDA
jgi:hypothetical protein